LNSEQISDQPEEPMAFDEAQEKDLKQTGGMSYCIFHTLHLMSAQVYSVDSFVYEYLEYLVLVLPWVGIMK